MSRLKVLLTKLFLVLPAVLLLSVAPAWSQSDFNFLKHEPGIFNENLYQEVVFISGEPVVMRGTVTVRPGRMRDGAMDIRYKVDLENAASQASLTRNITLHLTRTDRQDIGQQIDNLTVNSYNERININGMRYELVDFQFSKSLLTDFQPTVQYFSGTWSGRKTYLVNRNEAEVTIELLGETVGYEHYWGNTETQQLQYQYVSRSLTGNERHNWVANTNVHLAFNRNKGLEYWLNEPGHISFAGGYVQAEKWENILSYDGLLPEFSGDGKLDGYTSVAGRVMLNSTPVVSRLPVYRLQDIQGHWAQQEIERLVSLGAFSSQGDFFGSGLPMRRSEFARAIVVVMGMEAEKTAVSEDVFVDVPSTHRDYEYIVKVQKLGIIKGLGPNQFAPDGELTRVQAVTIMVRALGLDTLAPNPGFGTPFGDDEVIPAWAKNSVYVAQEIGLVQGDRFGYLWPNDILTKAEAAVMLDRFINYLQTKIKEDYRENIINFR